MPVAVQRTAQQLLHYNLQELLVKATTDAESWSVRRFSITALSHLRTVTPDVVSALLAGLQDNSDGVRQDTITAVERFQFISGNPLPRLTPALTGESMSTAYMVAQLLGTLGVSAAGQSAGLRDEIITALVDALNHSNSQREVVFNRYIGSKESGGEFANELYTDLFGEKANAPHDVDPLIKAMHISQPNDSEESKGKFADTLYAELLRVAGWPT
jgi:hypothetical protein